MHIDARSWYSFHDGVASPAELCAQAAELGFDALGIADVDGCYGLIQFYKAAVKQGIKPLLGLQLTLPNETTHTQPGGSGPGQSPATKNGDGDQRLDAGDRPSATSQLASPHVGAENNLMQGFSRGVDTSAPPSSAVTVIAGDRDGYSQLCELAAWRHGCLFDSDASLHCGGTEPAVSPPVSTAMLIRLLERADRCYVLSNREELLRALAPRLGPERLLVRIAPNLSPAHRSRQLRQLKLARRYRLRPAACTDVRFTRPQDQSVHRVLRAIGQCTHLHAAQGTCPSTHYLAAPTELAGYYYDCPEALANTRKLADACQVDFELGRWVFPDYELPGGGDPARALYQLCLRGQDWRFGRGKWGSRHSARLEMELRVIAELGYTSYFLAVYDIVREAGRRRIPCLGRGSAANSLVSYVLGLTPVDPLRYNMYFERFLNKERKSPPDIDIDFNWRRRDEIIQYVYDRWGAGRVAMISTHVTYRARSALREVAKAFGLSDREISTISRHLPSINAQGLTSVVNDFPEMRGIDFSSEPYCHVLPLASRLAGKPRHLGIHCGGVIVAPGRVTDYTGLQRAAKGFVVTQYDMFPVEDVGLIKIDLLGNRSLGVYEDVMRSLSRRAKAQGPGTRDQGLEKKDRGLEDSDQGPKNTGSGGLRTAANNQCATAQSDHMHSMPTGRDAPSPAETLHRIQHYERVATDPATVAMIREGLTMGCFYIESPGMRQLLRRLRTQTFLELTAASSVIRPGVADSGMMQEYIRRTRGQAPEMPTHPLMHKLLPETHGVMIYQEDVIRTAHELAGMSLSQADLLRRAMSGKLRGYGAMNEVRERFLAGCEENGIDAASALSIWRQMASFAGYSFCKAHSASFATLSFQLAYCKAHHPAEFMAAVLANGGGFYGPRAYLSECERLGLRVLPPDVNHSQLAYTPEYVAAGKRGWGTRDQRLGAGDQGLENMEQGSEKAGSGGAGDASIPACGCEPSAIRVGLGVIKGVSSTLLERTVAQRGQRGPFTSLPDFIRRTRPHEKDLLTLIRAGALDSLGLTRPELIWLARSERKAGVRINHSHSTAPGLPFDDSERIDAFRAEAGAKLDDYDELQLCALELEHLGLLVRRHPLTLFCHHISGVVEARDLPRYTGKWVRMLGWCIATKRVDLGRKQSVQDVLALQADTPDIPEQYGSDDDDERVDTATDIGIIAAPGTRGYAQGPGRAMKFMSMEDLTGTFEVTLFAEAYAKFAQLTYSAGPFLVVGKVEEHFDTYTVNCTQLRLIRLEELEQALHPRSKRHGGTVRPPREHDMRTARSGAIRGASRGQGNNWGGK